VGRREGKGGAVPKDEAELFGGDLARLARQEETKALLELGDLLLRQLVYGRLYPFMWLARKQAKEGDGKGRRRRSCDGKGQQGGPAQSLRVEAGETHHRIIFAAHRE